MIERGQGGINYRQRASGRAYSMTSVAHAAPFDGVDRESDGQLLHRLLGENLALQSILYGLCMGLCHMSELHREAVVQAMDYAAQTPTALELSRSGQKSEAQAFNETISQLRLAVFERYRSF
jgi:hypothetical protein